MSKELKKLVDINGLREFKDKFKTISTIAETFNAETFNADATTSDSGLIASNSSTGHSLLFGIGISGVNRGIFDNKNLHWSVFLDDTDYIMTQCPTPPEGDSSNKLATTEWVQNELAKLRQALSDIQGLQVSGNP